MKKIGDVTSTAGKNGEWTNGNVAAGIPPTILESGWLNSVQREILGVLTKAGIPQDKNNDNQLSEAISKIITGGNYATVEDLKKKLTKDQNGADIPSKPKFIENLGLGEAAKSGVKQTTGTSKTDVISQDGVTKALNGKADGERFSTRTSAVIISSPNGNYGVEINNTGVFAVTDLSGESPVPIFRVLSTGEINDGTIPLGRVTGTGSAASKNTGTGLGQIPDMSSFGFSNGAYTFPNGLILQVFSVTPSATNPVTPVTFPVPFPNAPHGVWMTHNSSPLGQFMTCDALTKTGANMRVFKSDSTSPTTGSGTVTIMALGR